MIETFGKAFGIYILLANGVFTVYSSGGATAFENNFGLKISGSNIMGFEKRNREKRNLRKMGHFINISVQGIYPIVVDLVFNVLKTEYLQRLLFETFIGY